MEDLIVVFLKEMTGAPESFQVLPDGKIDIESDDPAYLDADSAEQVIEHFKARGNDMVIDYEHQTLKDDVQAPAAGWIKKLEYRGAQGLWAIVDWTEKAKNYILNREYRYFSPVMLVNKKTRKVLAIFNVALTNSPRINNLRPIIAKMSLDAARTAQVERSKKYKIGIKDGGHITKPSEWANVPDDEFLDPVNYRYPCPDANQTRAAAAYWGKLDNQSQYTAEERSLISERLNKFRKKFNIGENRKEVVMIERLKALLKLAADATEEKITEAVEAIVNKATELETKSNEVVACKEVMDAIGVKADAKKEEVIAVVAGMKAPGDVAVKLSMQVAELQKEISAMKQEDLVAIALKEGKTSPAELDAWGRDLALKNPDQFRLIVLSRPAGSVVPIDKIPQKKDNGGPAELDDAQRSINKLCGVDDETFKKYNK
ncbi:MAG: phage protease [Pseudomonadota bacterium]